MNFKSLVDLLKYRAIYQSDEKAYVFLQDGEQEEISLRYRDIHLQAQKISAFLQRVLAQGDRALLIYPSGSEFIAAFFGCLYSGVIAVPASLPQSRRSLPRLKAIINDSQPKVILTKKPFTTSQICDFDLAELPYIYTDEIDTDLSDNWQEPPLSEETLAFLQYTSGSTGNPKGVMVSHANILHNESLIQRGFGHTERSTVVGWLPLFHDMGLIGNVLQPLYMGIPCVLMSPVSVLQQPVRWLQAISRYKATTSGGPNFIYDLCTRRISDEQKSTLDLSTWEVAFNGAEPIRSDTLDRFALAFESCGFRKEAFYPCYGMAETTLIVSGGDKQVLPLQYSVDSKQLASHQVSLSNPGTKANQMLVGCGVVLPGLDVAIVHPETLNACKTNEVGEIWVKGPSVAQGYWRNTEETARTFQAYVQDLQTGPFLRTGDLGFLRDGELFITGRIKDLIIIRGRNHYPQDIEWTVQNAHPALQPDSGAAFALDIAGEEKLVVVQEITRSHLRHLDVYTVMSAIRQAVSEMHELTLHAIVLLKPGGLPKTSSGKVQRNACRIRFIEHSFDAIASILVDLDDLSEFIDSLTRDDLLQIEPERQQQRLIGYLQSVIASVLKSNPACIDSEQSLNALGIDSLGAISVQYRIEQDLAVSLPMATVLQVSNIHELAVTILQSFSDSTDASDDVAIDILSIDAAPRLSYGQRALWFVHQLAPNSAAYHISHAVKIGSALDKDALHRVFQKLLDRHSALRTSFNEVSGEPVSKVNETANVDFQTIDVSALSEEEIRDHLQIQSQQPFDLTQDSLLRIRLFKQNPEKHILLMVIHHIVADFWSLAILMDELSALYTAEITSNPDHLDTALPALPHSYIDYARWQSKLLSGAEGDRHWQYWQQQLAGELPILALRGDYPRPPIQTYQGASISCRLGAELTHQIRKLSQQSGATLYMTLLAAFQVLLHRYTGQNDILVGSPTAGRSRQEFAGVMGYFVNPIVLRANFEDNPTFEAFLAQVRQTSLDAFEHQDFPFSLLVERLQPERDPSRSPVFQTMFALQKAPRLDKLNLAAMSLGESGISMQLGSLSIESFALPQRTAQFDLTLVIAELTDDLVASFEYNTDLFEAETISQLAQHFLALLNSIVTEPTQSVSHLTLLSEDERHKILHEWNATQKDYPCDVCIHQLFEAQVERTPDAIALVFEGQTLTYRELNNRANQLAHYLQTVDVVAEKLVGICVERSLEMVVGVLGILKAGGAYVPLDPTYPKERLAFMLEDAQVPVLLTQERLVGGCPERGARVVCLDTGWETIALESEAKPVSGVTADNLAYVIYTSGSTGKPKGVMTSHRAVCNYLYWMQTTFPLTESDRILQKYSFSFDVSVWEIFGPLLVGARLIMVRPGGHQDIEYLVQLIADQKITFVDLMASMFQVFLETHRLENCSSLKRVTCGGEAMSVELQERFFERLDAKLYNLYGPTEATIGATFWTCERGSHRRIVPIGRPIANTQLYILDAYLEPVPLGVPGELHIGGVCLALGYLNQPALTVEKFISNPFSDEPGARLYKTGDLVRYLPDGNIEFLGRIDHQVKIRGFRIELGEIEAALRQHPLVQEALVLIREEDEGQPPSQKLALLALQLNKQIAIAPTNEDKPGGKRLVAYLVPSQGQVLTNSELRRFLMEKLPEYMIPSAFVHLNALPLMPNGKVNRRALPAPDTARPELEGTFVAPNTLVEKVVAGIWTQLLGLEQVGIHDDFFELGGHSLLATQVIFRVRDIFQVDLPLRSLFEAPTVAALSHGVLTYEAKPGQSEKIARALKRIEGMSAKEMRETLQQKKSKRGDA